MKAKAFVGLSLLALTALLVGAVSAQGPGPQVPLPPSEVPPVSEWPPFPGPEGKPFAPFAAAPEVGVQSVGAASVSLGQPGTVFRYVQTFGVTETPYISTTTHLNYPYGLGAQGNSIWIGEMWGNRFLKYASDGSFQQSFGHAGFAEDYTDTSFWGIVDVATNGSGNIWVVDAASSRVVELNAAGQALLTLGERWNRGGDNGHFEYPISVAFDAAGNIYVSDGAPWWNREGGNHRIQIFQSNGTYLTTIGQTGVCGSDNDRFCGPRHIAIYANELYVADAGNDRVQIFDISTPTSPSHIATISGLNNPSGVAVDAAYIYVANTWNHQVLVFDRSTRNLVATIGTGWGTGNDQFKNPSDVAVDAAGNLYVADFVNTRVQQFTQFGGIWQYARTYGETGVPYITNNYHYNTPSSVAVATDGSIYLTEDKGHRLVKLAPDGTQIWTVGAAGVKGDWDASSDRLNNPDDVALDASGRIYVADRWHGRVQIYNPDGSYHATVGDLDCPGGVAIGPNGYLYVANSCNHTVRIYDAGLVLIATLGTPGEAGTDNTHFNSPEDVAVDGSGTIYVADVDNHRVQVFNADRQYVRTMGETGVSGNDFAHFNHPNGLFVDSANRLYVGDEWNHRIQVFDASGAYLTTIGGGAGPRTGQIRGARGVAVDSAGNVYVADNLNHRIQKFAPGVPGWKQVNLNGFGERANRINSLAPFGGYLYAGTFNFGGNGAQLWRMDTAGNWTAVMTNGFGNVANVGIDHLLEFNGQLYAGTWANKTNGGEIWRSSDGTNWNQVASSGFGDPTNGEVMRLGVFNGQIYASTWSYTNTHGAEIWRSDTGDAGDWEQVVSNGFGDTTNRVVMNLVEFNGAFYAGTKAAIGGAGNGADLWRSVDGLNWTPVITDGFGYTGTYDIAALAVFQNYLYAGIGRYDLSTQSYPGGQIWRCSQTSNCDEPGDWERVTGDGFGNPNNINFSGFAVHGGYLYTFPYNMETGMEVWRSQDGINWERVGEAGLGDSNNQGTYWDNSIAVFNNRLFIGTTNEANGGEVWLYLHRQVFLPLVLRGR